MRQTPKSPTNAEISEYDDGQGMVETVPRKTGRYRGLVGILVLALFSYVVSLMATAPASLLARLVNMPTAVTSLSGSIWHGQARLSGGHAARWSVAPLDSLSKGGLALQWSLEGPGTRLEGDASLHPNRFIVNDTEGRVSWRLLNSLVPELPISCDAQARVAIQQAVLSDSIKRVAGELRSGPSVCASVGTTSLQSVEVPPLLAVATLATDGSRIEITTVADVTTTLARATLTNQNTLALTIFPAGARLIPGMPTSGETSLEYPL